MDLYSFLRAILALAVTIGLIGLAAALARKYAPGLLAKLQARKGERRLEVIETLVLDPTRRLLLVRIDDEERLLLVGDGRELEQPLPRSAAVLKRRAA